MFPKFPTVGDEASMSQIVLGRLVRVIIPSAVCQWTETLSLLLCWCWPVFRCRRLLRAWLCTIWKLLHAFAAEAYVATLSSAEV